MADSHVRAVTAAVGARRASYVAEGSETQSVDYLHHGQSHADMAACHPTQRHIIRGSQASDDVWGDR